MPLAAVEAGQLFEVAWVALLAGVAVTTAYSFVVLFGARSAEAGRAGRAGAAALYAGVALLAFLVFAAVVVFGVRIMLSK